MYENKPVYVHRCVETWVNFHLYIHYPLTRHNSAQNLCSTQLPCVHNSSLFVKLVGRARNLNIATPCGSTVAIIVPDGCTVVTFPSNIELFWANPSA